MSNSIVKGASLLTISQIVVAVCSFTRNIFIARLISVEDYGIASLFAIVISVAETISYMGIDRFLVQAKDGDLETVQSAAQFFSAVRGTISAILILLCSSLFSKLFGLPGMAWAFGTLAIIPFVRGFAHLDMVRLQRKLDFSPTVWVDTVPQVVVLALSVPLALWLEDYRVMLWIAVLQAILYLFVSHLFATRSYKLSADISALRAIFDFGWPLLINALLMFGIYQGDRIIVGIMLSPEELGYFSAVFTLLMTPAMLVIRVFGTTALPILSNSAKNLDSFESNSSMTIQISFAISISFGILLAIGGPSIFVAFFGEKYQPATLIFSWVALIFAIRIISSGLITIALSIADTKIAMYANVIRSGSLILSFSSLYLGYGLLGVAVSGLVGELFALLTTMYLLARRRALSFRSFTLNYFILFASLGFTMYVADTFAKGNHLLLEAALSILLLIPALSAMLYASPDAHSAIANHTHRLLRSVKRSHD